MRARIEKMISPDYVLCYLPRVLEIFWEKIVDKKDDFKEEGVFILKYTSGSSDMDKYIFYNKPLEVFHDIFSEMSKPHSKYDSGDILILTFDNNKFHMFER